MRIIDLAAATAEQRAQAAAILVLAFREHWPEAWPDEAAAEEEVRTLCAPDHIARAAVDEAEQVLGWIGGLPEYDGHVWELHPLAVHPDQQRRGVGRALVADFEAQVRARGALTVMLGTDDDDAMTSLAGADVYPDLWERVRAIRNLKNHPYAFYEKLGYQIVGVIPDANGWGKPDILMAKRVGEST